jgi:D-hydroxyproline dehydrogenase
MADRSTLVVGGGIVGLACALEAQRRGRIVTLIDQSDPGHGCSLGNAGIVAVSEIFPLITASRVIGLPRMLTSRYAPAVVRLSSLPRFLPWMTRAAITLSKARQRAITNALVELNVRSVAAWRALLESAGAARLLRERGMVRLIRDARDWSALSTTRDRLARHGLSSCLLNGDEVRALEPALGRCVIGGLLHESDADIGDPLDLTRAMLKSFQAAGGVVSRQRALTIRPRENGAEVITPSGAIHADQILVTLGLGSADALKHLGVVVPLQAERGYHLSISSAGSLLSRPVTFQRESCVGTPMGPALRLAGTVEFADDNAPPDWSRADRLVGHAAHYFDLPPQRCGASRWIGSRPSLPDSLPAIGRLKSSPSIGYAFGHQHLGVTQAAISAKLLCELMADETPAFDHRPYDVARF